MKKLVRPFVAGMFLGALVFVGYLRISVKDAVLGESAVELSSYPTATPTVTPSPTLTPKPTNTPSPSSTPTPSLTPTPTLTPTPIIAPADLENFFNQYASQYGIDGQLLRRIAWCESRFNSGAVNGPYVGLYQFLDSIWITYRTQMGHDTNSDLRADANEAIKTAAYIVSLGKLHLWPNCVD